MRHSGKSPLPGNHNPVTTVYESMSRDRHVPHDACVTGSTHTPQEDLPKNNLKIDNASISIHNYRSVPGSINEPIGFSFEIWYVLVSILLHTRSHYALGHGCRSQRHFGSSSRAEEQLSISATLHSRWRSSRQRRCSDSRVHRALSCRSLQVPWIRLLLRRSPSSSRSSSNRHLPRLTLLDLPMRLWGTHWCKLERQTPLRCLRGRQWLSKLCHSVRHRLLWPLAVAVTRLVPCLLRLCTGLLEWAGVVWPCSRWRHRGAQRRGAGRSP